MDGTVNAFVCGSAEDGTADALVRDCLADMSGTPTDANLGLVYASDALDGDLNEIVTTLQRETGIRDWAGTLGYGVSTVGREMFDLPALSVLVGAFPEESFRVVPSLTTPGEALPPALNDWVGRMQPHLGLIHADPRNAYVPEIIQSLGDDTEAFLIGGLTASRGEFHQIAGGVTEGGLSGVLFSEAVASVTGLTQGCAPIGPVREVGDCEDNLLATLDGRRALDALLEDLGAPNPRDLRQALANIHIALPISGGERGDYLVRNLMGLDPGSGVLAIGERLRAGDRVMFVRRDADSALVDLERMLDDLTERAETPPKAALYISCIARGPNLFGRNSEELRMIRDRIGDVPLTGFFANGEIFNTRLYSYTGVLTLLL